MRRGRACRCSRCTSSRRRPTWGSGGAVGLGAQACGGGGTHSKAYACTDACMQKSWRCSACVGMQATSAKCCARNMQGCGSAQRPAHAYTAVCQARRAVRRGAAAGGPAGAAGAGPRDQPDAQPAGAAQRAARRAAGPLGRQGAPHGSSQRSSCLPHDTSCLLCPALATFKGIAFSQRTPAQFTLGCRRRTTGLLPAPTPVTPRSRAGRAAPRTRPTTLRATCTTAPWSTARQTPAPASGTSTSAR